MREICRVYGIFRCLFGKSRLDFGHNFAVYNKIGRLGGAVQNRGDHLVDRAEDELVVYKPHVGLVGVNVYVHHIYRHIDKERVNRVISLHCIGRIGL